TPCRKTPADPNDALLAAYLDHLFRVRGLEPKTCEGLLLAARRSLIWLRHGGALERARWRRVGQEHSRAADPRPGMQDVVCKRRSCFVQERNDSVALPLGSPHKDFCGCVSSEGWHVQQGKGLPGQESE